MTRAFGLSLTRVAPPALMQYDAKLCELLDTHTKVFLVHADNVGSKQFMDIRAVSRAGQIYVWGCSAGSGGGTSCG